MSDIPDVTASLNPDLVPVRILEQCLHIRALLTLILQTQTMMLCEQTGKDFMEVSEGQIDLMTEHVTEWLTQAHKADSIFEVADDNDPTEEK